MKLSFLSSVLACLISLSTSTILENGHVRETHFLDTRIDPIGSNSSSWKTYGPNATELSYKGRWDSKHISWWAAPGLKFSFTGPSLAITFGPHTSPSVLIAYRLDGLDWSFTNITTNGTHQLISSSIPPSPSQIPTSNSTIPRTFELRVTNWAYGIQISAIHVTPSAELIKVPNFGRTIEFIGDSLTSGMYATYEAFSGFGYMIGAGLGETEFSVVAYPGICLTDAECWGNKRGQVYQWGKTSDTSGRASQRYGDEPEEWDHTHNGGQGTPDLVIINLGTNDNNTANNVKASDYYTSYISLISNIHTVYPKANIILMSLWNGFDQSGSTYKQSGAFMDEIYAVYKKFESQGFVHYFNSTGILQHNDIGPQWHPTDVGHIKIASHVMQYIRMKFGWEFKATGPEVQHETLYWNDESGY